MATHCLPITRKTYLDPENLGSLIEHHKDDTLQAVTKFAVADFQNNLIVIQWQGWYRYRNEQPRSYNH